MSETRFATKVGVFMFIGLATLAALLLNFSKNTDVFHPTYKLYLRTSNVSGIKKRAGVLMAGVPIGYVDTIELAPDNKTVIMQAKIYQEYHVRRSAMFSIEQSGFLGDMNVAITPSDNFGLLLQDGDMVRCEPPFDLQDTARRAGDLLGKVGTTISDLKTSISNVNEVVLKQSTLTNIMTNFVATLENLRMVSESIKTNVPPALEDINKVTDSARMTVQDIQMLVRENTSSFSRAVGNLYQSSSNILTLSESLKRTGVRVDQLVEVNGSRVATTLKNVETASATVTNLVDGLKRDLDQGHGLVGALLKDEAMRKNADAAIGNMSQLSSNLTVASENLNKHGLWWMLWEPKKSKTNRVITTKSAQLQGKKW